MCEPLKQLIEETDTTPQRGGEELEQAILNAASAGIASGDSVTETNAGVQPGPTLDQEIAATNKKPISHETYFPLA